MYYLFASYFVSGSRWPLITTNFLSEGVSCGLDTKIARMGSTLMMYVPFWLLIERSQMTPYHKKFLVRRG